MSAAGTLALEIVTPQGVILSEQVEMVLLPGASGQIGILPAHTRLIAQIVPGELVAAAGGRRQVLVVGEGLADITATAVSVLTDMAISGDRADEAAIEAARQRAAARQAEKVADEDVAAVNASLARALAQLPAGRRRRPR
jgi:F-type H+-transporting ATPase subunit epsilon